MDVDMTDIGFVLQSCLKIIYKPASLSTISHYIITLTTQSTTHSQHEYDYRQKLRTGPIYGKETSFSSRGCRTFEKAILALAHAL